MIISSIFRVFVTRLRSFVLSHIKYVRELFFSSFVIEETIFLIIYCGIPSHGSYNSTVLLCVFIFFFLSIVLGTKVPNDFRAKF